MKIVNEKEYKPRLVDKTIEKYLQVAKAICIEGPKWCGKTWASSYHANSEYLVGNPTHNFQNRKLAELEPSSVLIGERPRLIDEWQEVPSLWDAVRMTVDQSVQKGQFILTGSSTPVNKGILHSGTGRIVRIKMHTMSLYESGDSEGIVSLKEICNGTWNKTAPLVSPPDLEKLAYFICRGGWPDNISQARENISIMPSSYLETAVNEDLQRLDDGVTYDKDKINLLIRSLARNESTAASNRILANDISETDGKTVSEETIARYMSALKRIFLIENQEPYSPNIRSSLRVKQKEKRHFCDPALACAALHLTPSKLIGDLETFGFLFESLAERDLRIYAEAEGAHIYHYQDYKNNEIDAVIESEDGDWSAFEIKLGASQIDKAAENLIRIRNVIQSEGGKEPKSLCVLCGLTNAAYKREDGVYVIPITALKN